MSIADPNKTILTGENPFIRLSLKDGDPNSTDASYWRIIFSPAGPGHVLYLKSELTEGRWRIYSDNIAMARWLQTTVQGISSATALRPRGNPGRASARGGPSRHRRWHSRKAGRTRSEAERQGVADVCYWTHLGHERRFCSDARIEPR